MKRPGDKNRYPLRLRKRGGLPGGKPLMQCSDQECPRGQEERMKRHPEQTTAEHWVGNISGSELPEHVRPLSSARLGKIAYDIDGKPLDPQYHRPLFIGDADYQRYDQIMMAGFNAIRR